MDLSEPITAVVPSLDAAVLRVLSGTTEPLTGAQIYALCRRGSYSGVRNVLARLTEQGITHRNTHGQAGVYVGNRSHLAWPAVERLVDLRGELIRRIRGEIGEWEITPISAQLFGSAARADGTVKSDIDIWLVQPRLSSEQHELWSDQAFRLQRQVEAWTGNRATILQSDWGEVREMLAHEAPITVELRRDGIPLAGLTVPEMFLEAT